MTLTSAVKEGFIETKKTSTPSFWNKLGRWSLYLLVFLVPLWILPLTSNPLTTNKVALSYFLIILAFFSWLIDRIKTGRAFLPKNYLALSLILLVVVWFLSGIFSISPHVSFFELSGDTSSFFAILMFIMAAFVAYFHLRSSKETFVWFCFLFSSAILIFILQFLRVVFGINAFFWINFPSAVSNVFGLWYELGIFFSIIGVLSIFLFEVLTDRKIRASFLVLSFVSLSILIVVNISIIWWVTFSFLMIILAYLLSLKPHKMNVFRASFFALLIVLFFIQIPAISSAVISQFGLDSIEVRPSWSSSWTVIQKTLKDSSFLGSGPATFVYDWLRFKPLVVNESIFWAMRFSNGTAFVPSLLASVGTLGFAAFLFMILSFLYYMIRVLTNSGKTHLDSSFILILLSSLMILTYLFIYTAGFTLTLFLFLFFGIFMAFISKNGFAKEYKINLFQNSGIGFVSSLVIIFFLIISFSGLYIFGQKYASAYFAQKSLESGAGGNISEARDLLDKALVFDRRDVYLRTAVSLELADISSLLNRTDLSSDELRDSFQNFLSRAIQNAQSSVSLNPIDPLNWMSLGSIYEAIIPFNISGASDFANNAYLEASLRNPTGPDPILAQARVAMASNKLDEAKELLQKSLTFKSNYTPAHFLLAQIEDSKGNLAQAIKSAESAVVLSPNELGVLFQLGLLYYRSDLLENSRLVFERAVSLNRNYSNARYFLGLIYDRQGKKEAAIEQFEALKALNPQNREVEIILDNLLEGRSALSNISPPPEERTEPPVEE